MILRMNGKRLSAKQVDFLLETVGFREVHDDMISRGYTLNPIRAPKCYPRDGRLEVRFSWTIREPKARLTLRYTGTVDVRPA